MIAAKSVKLIKIVRVQGVGEDGAGVAGRQPAGQLLQRPDGEGLGGRGEGRQDGDERSRPRGGVRRLGPGGCHSGHQRGRPGGGWWRQQEHRLLRRALPGQRESRQEDPGLGCELWSVSLLSARPRQLGERDHLASRGEISALRLG